MKLWIQRNVGIGHGIDNLEIQDRAEYLGAVVVR